MRLFRASLRRQFQPRPKSRSTTGISQRDVGVEHARIALQILLWTELERIHKHAHQSRALSSSALNQRTMALVETSHGGHELKITGLLFKPGSEVCP